MLGVPVAFIGIIVVAVEDERVSVERSEVSTQDSVPSPSEPVAWENPRSGNDPRWATADCKHFEPYPSTPYGFDTDEEQAVYMKRQNECHPRQKKSAAASKPSAQKSEPMFFSETDTKNQYATTYGQFRSAGYGHGEAADKTRDFLNKNGFDYSSINRLFRLGVQECFDEMSDSFCGRSSY